MQARWGGPTTDADQLPRARQGLLQAAREKRARWATSATSWNGLQKLSDTASRGRCRRARAEEEGGGQGGDGRGDARRHRAGEARRDEQQKQVNAESEKIGKEEAETKITRRRAADLDEALPALEAAQKALELLNKKDMAEVKAYAKPPRRSRWSWSGDGAAQAEPRGRRRRSSWATLLPWLVSDKDGLTDACSAR